MKIVVLAIVLFSALLAQPSFAKDARAQHAHRSNRAASAAPHGHAGKAAADTRANEPADTPATAILQRSGFAPDKGRGANASLKIGVPGNSQARHAPVVGPPNPVARNAIGVPVAPHEGLPPSSGDYVGGVPRIPPTVPTGNGIAAKSPEESRSANIGQVGVHPAANGSISNAGVSSRGRIGGGAPIRPLAAAGLGGPAKVVAGINGTTVRLKR